MRHLVNLIDTSWDVDRKSIRADPIGTTPLVFNISLVVVAENLGQDLVILSRAPLPHCSVLLCNIKAPKDPVPSSRRWHTETLVSRFHMLPGPHWVWPYIDSRNAQAPERH